MEGYLYAAFLRSATIANGRGICKAIEYLLPNALDEKTWSAKQIVPMERDRMYLLLGMDDVKFGHAKTKQANDKLASPDLMKSRTNLVLPRGLSK